MRSRREFLVGTAALAACAKTGTKTPVPTTTTSEPPTTEGPPQRATFVRRGPATQRVALTFHTAGDPAIATAILEHAAAENVKLTFFVVGTWLEANPGMVEPIKNGGHDFGNHTWSHVDIKALGPDAMHAEIAKCADALQRETGSIARWFRPSQTDIPTDAILAQAGSVGYATSVGYDVDPLDYQNPGATRIVSRVRASVQPGSIVSLHTLYQGTADAFAGIVAAIRAKGLEPVTVATLLE